MSIASHGHSSPSVPPPSLIVLAAKVVVLALACVLLVLSAMSQVVRQLR